jgi:hypothetical protein
MTLRGSILNEADVVAATLSSSGKQQFLDHILQEELDFDTAIVDEAAQTTEPSTLIPLRYGCRSLVLVGDPRQLPATVLSPRAERAGLGRSLRRRRSRGGDAYCAIPDAPRYTGVPIRNILSRSFIYAIVRLPCYICLSCYVYFIYLCYLAGFTFLCVRTTVFCNPYIVILIK